MRERTSLNGFPTEFILKVRQVLVDDWGISEEYLLDPAEIRETEGPLGQTFSPLKKGFVIHPVSKEVIGIPDGFTCQRNYDGTPVHIKADGTPVFFQNNHFD